MQWNITVTAVHDYQRILKLRQDEDGPGFDDPAKELSKICESAVYKETDNSGEKWHAVITVKGKTVRLELSVSKKPSPEDPLPQLVRVRKR